jgi:hypothetical protein
MAQGRAVRVGLEAVPRIDFGALGSDLADGPWDGEYACLGVDARAAITGVSHWLIERCDHLTERIVRECTSPDMYDHAAAFARNAVRSVASVSTEWILQSVVNEIQGSGIAAPAELDDRIRMCTRQKISLDVVLRIFQIQHSYLWQQYVFGLERLLSCQTTLAASCSAVSRRLFEWSDALTEAASRSYVDELTDPEPSAEARRWREVKSILEQSGSQEPPPHGSLAWPMGGSHIGMTAWKIDATGAGELGKYVQRIERTAGAPLMSVRDDEGAIHVWLNRKAAVDGDLLTSLGPPHNIALAVGEPAKGVAGFRRTHQQAQLTRMLMEQMDPPSAQPQLWLYREHQLAALAVGSTENMRSFVTEQLVALADESEASEQLCETIDVFFASGMNKIKTAEKLRIHRNTLCYRLDRAAALRGRALLEQQVEMAVAIRLRQRSPGMRSRRDRSAASL